MATSLQVILDDNDLTQFTYSGGEWTLSTLVQWFRQTSNYPAFAGDGTSFGTFSLSFEGTSIAFWGNTPVLPLSQIATVSIDGGKPYNTTYGTLAAPPAYIQWYQSPTLPDGTHNITVSHLAGTSVDFALITVGENTPLAGKRLIMDNENSAIQYSSGWVRSPNPFNAGTLPDGYPVGNSTHRSTAVGDTITLQFSGSSLEVYGIFSWGDIGVLAATYTVDGVSSAQTYTVTPTTANYVSDDGDAVNTLLFSTDSISNGTHTLVINITEAQNQTFAFDYITYLPSFSSLATMPNLTTYASSSSSSTSTLPSSSSSASSSASSSSGNPSLTAAGSTKGAPVGAIVGGVVGGLAVLVLAVFLFSWLRKRKEETSNIEGFDQVQMEQQVSSVPRNSNLTPVSPFPVFPATAGWSRRDIKRERQLGNAQTYGTPGSRETFGGEHNPPSYDTLSSHGISSPPSSPQ